MTQFAPMARYRITRESLLDGTHHARIRADQGAHVTFMPDGERRVQVLDILAQAPRPERIWVFGYTHAIISSTPSSTCASWASAIAGWRHWNGACVRCAMRLRLRRAL